MQKNVVLKKNAIDVVDNSMTNSGTVVLYKQDQGTRTMFRMFDTDASIGSQMGKRLVQGSKKRILQYLDTLLEKNEVVLPSKGKKGRTVQSSRLFGIELEFTQGRDSLRDQTHRNNSIMVGNDGSVNGQGIEVRSTPVSGTTAERAIRSLDLTNARVDTSCGMHIHVDARDIRIKMTGRTMKQTRDIRPFIRLVSLYLASQHLLFAVVPNSRRNNTYTKHIHTDHNTVVRALSSALKIGNVSVLEEVKNKEKLATQSRILEWAKLNVYGGDRYKYFNLAPFYNEGHYEVRVHSGTADTKKILEWANLHTLMADACAVNGKVTPSLLRELFTSTPKDGMRVLGTTIGMKPSSVSYFLSRIEQFKGGMRVQCDECGELTDYSDGSEDSDGSDDGDL